LQEDDLSANHKVDKCKIVGTVSTCEFAIKIVTYDERKWLLRCNQAVTKVRLASLNYAFVTHKPSGQQQAPNPTGCKRNVETVYRPFFFEKESTL